MRDMGNCFLLIGFVLRPSAKTVQTEYFDKCYIPSLEFKK